MPAELAQLHQQRPDTLQVSRQHDLIAGIDIGDEDLLDRSGVGRGIVPGGRCAGAQERVHRLDQGCQPLGFADHSHHPVFTALIITARGPAACRHYFRAAPHHLQRRVVPNVPAADERGEFPQGVPEAEVDARAGVEAEVPLQHAQHHDADGHDGRLGVFGRCQGRVGPGGDDARERRGQHVVDFLEEGNACCGEGGEPGSCHPDALHALPWEEECGFGARGGAVGSGSPSLVREVGMPGLSAAVDEGGREQ